LYGCRQVSDEGLDTLLAGHPSLNEKGVRR